MCRILEGSHASFVELVPFKIIAAFTGLQLAYFLICYGVTWIPTGAILFPLPFFLLIFIRESLLPKLFKPQHLQELDALEYEEIAGDPRVSQRIPLMTVPFIYLFISCQYKTYLFFVSTFLHMLFDTSMLTKSMKNV